MDIFWYFSDLLSSTFSTFWTYNNDDFVFFFSPGIRGNMQFLAQIRHIISAIFLIFFPSILSYILNIEYDKTKLRRLSYYILSYFAFLKFFIILHFIISCISLSYFPCYHISNMIKLDFYKS